MKTPLVSTLNLGTVTGSVYVGTTVIQVDLKLGTPIASPAQLVVDFGVPATELFEAGEELEVLIIKKKLRGWR